MTSPVPSTADVLEKVGTLGPPGTPVTTPEVAENFDCTQRTIYNRLESLVKDGVLETKKVGANSRVWWRPVDGDFRRNGGASEGRAPVALRDGRAPSLTADSEMAERIREFEWANTPLGPMDEWPMELRVAVDMMLGADEAIGIYWGEDLTLLYNDLAREQIGEKHPDALGRPAREVFPEAWEVLGPVHEQVMAGEGAVRVEEQYLPLERGGDIEDVWFDSSFNPIPCADGSVGGVFNVSVEVTDRVRAEARLRNRQQESERRYETVLNSMDEGFFLADVVFDRDGEPLDIFYRDSNPAAVEMVGEEFEGRWLTEIDMGYEDYWYEVFGRVASTGEGERHELYAEPDDIWYNFYVFKPEGAGPRRVAVVFEDITERKEAEQELRESEEALSNILAQLPIGVGVLNADGRYEVRNDRMEEILDGDLLPSRDPEKQGEWSATDADGDPLPPEQWPGARALRGETVSPGIEFRLDRDGETRWFNVTGVPFEESGDEPKAIGVVQEITEQKQREERQEFLLRFSDALRAEPDPQSIGARAVEMVAEYLDLDRCYISEVFEEDGYSTVGPEQIRPDLPEMSGTFQLSDYPETMRQLATQPMVVQDAANDPRFSESEKELLAGYQLRSLLVTPLRSGEENVVWALAAANAEPRDWTDGERALLEEAAERTWAAVERARAEEEIRKREEKYRTLFESIDEGFVTMEVLFDEDDEPVDLRFLETNSAFEEITGYDDVEGERMRDLDPDYDPQRVEKYGRVAETGDPERFTDQAEYLDDRWFDAFAFRIGEPQERTVAVLFSDITERKRREEATELLVEISDDLSRLSTPDEIIDTVGTRLGEFLDVSTCVFVDVDEATNEATVHHGWNTADVPSLEQTFQVEEYFSDEFARAGRAGETLVVRDTAHDDRANTEAYAQLNVGAFVTVPFHWEGRWVANVTVTTREARDWRRDEIELVEDIAARVFPRIERARAQQALTRSNQSLERLNAATQELIDAEAATIPDRIPQLLRDVLNVEYVALWRYDGPSGDLEEHAVDATEGVDPDVIEPGTDSSQRAWETFVGTEIDVENALDVESDVASPVRSRAFVPLGRHGVVCLGSTRTDTFDERMVDLIETVAATVETAWDRADSEVELAQRNEELTRLDHLNSLIRGIDQALVGADTRDTINEAVCEQLASTDLYESAWLATYDADTDTLRPQAWAGIDTDYLEDRTVTPGAAPDDDPLVAAHRTRKIQVVDDIATDARAAPWRETALARGARSCITIPLVYEESTYGILTVYGRTPQPDDRETDVLAELGETIAHAIRGLEASTTRETHSVVELTLRTTEARTPLARLAQAANCELTVEGLIPSTTDDAVTVFFTASEISPDDLAAASAEVLGIEALYCLDDRDDGSLYRARLTDEHLDSLLGTREAVVRSASVDQGTVTVVVDLPETGVVSEFLDDLRGRLPDVELLARTTRTRPLQTQYSLRMALEDRLTARQLEVLQLAYESGFFESPRVQTGKDLSKVLDVSQSTFTYHLRESQRRLCEMMFESA